MAIYAPAASPLIPLPTQPNDVAFPAAQWPEAEPPDSVDSERLAELLDLAAGQPAEFGITWATVVVHRGQIVGECYGPEIEADTTLISWSMAKSVVHAFVGMLVAEGHLDLSAPAPVPEWADPNDPRHAITLDQLLRMASGLEFVEDYVDEATSHCIEMLFGEVNANTAAYAASLPSIAPPGAVFNYSSGTTNIVSRLVAERIGQTVEAQQDWMTRRLFEPIGMTSAEPKFDDTGTFVGSSFLYATARDFARFGLLYLRDGVWDGQRLLPEGWVDYARTLSSANDDGTRYGAHWGLRPDGRGSFLCQGYETQRIRCVPANDLVVVRLGKTPVDCGPNVDAWIDEIVELFP